MAVNFGDTDGLHCGTSGVWVGKIHTLWFVAAASWDAELDFGSSAASSLEGTFQCLPHYSLTP